MNILLVTPLLDHGGGQRYITNLANYWASKGHRVTIVLMRSGDSFFKLSEKVEVFALNYSNKNTIKKVFTGFKASVKLRKIVKKVKPDFVLSILSSTNIFTLLSTKFLKVSVYVRDAMSPYRKRSKLERTLRKLLYKSAAGVIVMTQEAKKVVAQETGANNIQVIPNPVSHILRDNKVKKEKIVINVGRLSGVKGQQYFLEACAKINRPEWQFVILGEGRRRKQLTDQIKSLGLTKNVIMPGAVKDVGAWLNKSMIFVSTSISEAWGNAICEAMAAGLPVVSFNCEVGPREVITHNKDGFLAPVGNVDMLSKYIEDLMDNEKLRENIGQNARLRIEDLTIENISNQILEFCTR